jgi:N-acyl-D-aspartate/D-glutamate deacylase
MVKGGRIYNGSGMPSFVGDLAVKGGRVAEIGSSQGRRGVKSLSLTQGLFKMVKTFRGW